MELRISIEKGFNFLKKYGFWILFLVFILLFSLNVYVYYRYVHLVIRFQPDSEVKKVVVDEEVLNKILENIVKREESLSRIETTYYSDPFTLNR